MKDLKSARCKKEELTTDVLTGTYEEIHSDWKNKMHYASEENNNYLSFMTLASCQNFYNEMSSLYDIPRINVIEKYDPDDLNKTADEFDKAMEEWRELYKKFDKPIKKYNHIEEFLSDYLGTDVGGV